MSVNEDDRDLERNDAPEVSITLASDKPVSIYINVGDNVTIVGVSSE